MNRSVSVAAFLLGLAVVVWVGVGYVGLSPLALGMTALIGVVYVTGVIELLRFERATSALQRALDTIPPELPDATTWLRNLPPSLHNAVRLRLEGERVGLPGPALTPYLVGLLVLLGMLGTFLGMVMTLNGAVIALESTTDLHTIRSSLAAPVKGLGVAFGTSVAGVAASAMLGLISALCRRARLQASQVLDSRIALELRGFSGAQQRLEAFRAVQDQARTMPVLVETLHTMMAQMARQHREVHERMASEQQRFYDDARGSYSALAASVDASLQDSLTASARLAGQTIQPLVAEAMAGIARETAALQQRVGDGVQAQLDGVSQRLDAAVATVADTWTCALDSQVRGSEAVTTELQGALQAFTETFAQRSATLVGQVGSRQEAIVDRLDKAARALETSAQEQVSRTIEAVGSRQQAIVDRLDETVRALAASTHEQANRSIEQVSALMLTAAEAPRAAAEVIGELRQALSASIARDNAALDERNRIMETLLCSVDAINHASTEQREAIDALVASSASALERAAEGFEQRMASEATRLADTAGEVAGGAVEVASLAEGFGLAVQLFSESNEKLMDSLQHIEGALEKAMTRSDEQLAYYVAQARELIDLSLMSQQQIVGDLQRIPARQNAGASEG